MPKKIFIRISGFIVLGIFVMQGCYKTNTVVINPAATDTTTISFSSDITPILEASCAVSGCHVAGGKVPNLSTGVAYKSLQDGGYLVPNDPDNSVLMQWLNGKKTPAMPLGSGPDDAINAKFFAWINQGAKNN